MKSKKASLLKMPFFLGAVLLTLLFVFAAADCLADTDMIWTYGSGKNYSSLSTWEQDTDIIITSANNVVVVSHGVLTGSIGNGDTVTGDTSGAIGTVVGVVTDSQICIDVTSGDFQNNEQIYKTINVDYVVSSSAEDTLGIMYLDCYDGPHDDNVIVKDATTDSDHYRCIRSASDCTTPFAGKRETGAYFERATSGAVLKISENYSRIENIGAKVTANSSTITNVLNLVGDYTKAIGCIVYDSDNSGSGTVAAFQLIGNNSIAVNCIAHDNKNNGFVIGATGESVYAYNCTSVDNGAYGFNGVIGGTNYVWNCVADGNTNDDFNTSFHSNSDYNMSADTSAPGTNNKTSKDFTDMWASEVSGSEDYHLSTTGETDSDFQGGANPSGTLDPPDYTLAHDIDGQERETWYRGADEYNPRLYVWSGGSDVAPYISWATAAHSIQDAIDEASSGNIVTVRAGTYNENITMKDGVDVENYSTDVPKIDADGTDPAVTFDGVFSTGCTLDGFQVTAGGSDGGIYVRGTGAGIDNDTTIQNCEILYNNGPGINVDGGTALTAPAIDNNDIHNNDEEGIYVIDAGSSSVNLIITDNTIRDHSPDNAGINIGGDSYVTIGTDNDNGTIGDDNHIHDNKAGIAFDTGDPNTKPVAIADNHIEDNDDGGICQKDAITGKVTITKNDIEDNGKGGIGIKNSCELEIDRNEIHDNDRGGIHTGTDAANGGGFSGSMGSAVLTITGNKVHDNGDNHRGGIRFGWEDESDDHITDITNNTVVNNGTDGYGGGIIYDDLDGEVNDPPSGIPPAPLNIRNNICAYNEQAGIRACFTNTEGSEERDCNLVYGNHRWDSVHSWYNEPDCGWTNISMSCANQQYGGSGCGAHWDYGQPYPVVPNDPNSTMANPLFKSDCLTDEDTTTGNTPGNGTYILFDLHNGKPQGDPTTYEITHVRLYGSATSYTWSVYVGSSRSSCTDTGTWGALIKSSWSVGSGWNETSVTATSGRYIKLETSADINANTIFEFDYKSTETGQDWQTPILVVYECTDIAEDNYELLAGSAAKNAGDDYNDMGAYGGSDPME